MFQLRLGVHLAMLTFLATVWLVLVSGCDLSRQTDAATTNSDAEGYSAPKVDDIGGNPLRLLLGSCPVKKRVGEVCVTLLNEGQQSVAITPYFLPESFGESEVDHNILRFRVMDSQGRPRAFRGNGGFNKVAHPTPSDLMALAPGSFYGMHVDLTSGPFAHELQAGDTYEVTAELWLASGEWLLERFSGDSLRFASETIVTGRLESKRITLDLK